MEYRSLGSTGIKISAVSFGAGPVSGLMTAEDVDRQAAVIARAVEQGVNWFDTAATYGAGQSEINLGSALKGFGTKSNLHVATKVRLALEESGSIGDQIKRSFRASLGRLGLERVTLLQLHNAVTRARGDEPTSLSVRDVIGPGGVLDTFDELKASGQVQLVGLTGTGQPQAMREVIATGAFETIQVPYHLLNPSAGQPMTSRFLETDYGNVIKDCAEQNMGVLAIRVLAAGAIIGNRPSAHTLKTPFFPLDLYERDARRAARIQDQLGESCSMSELALRFVLSHPHVSSALIGFGKPAHVDEAVSSLNAGHLSDDVLQSLNLLRLDESDESGGR